MNESKVMSSNTPDESNPSVVRNYVVGNKNYIVESVFAGDVDIKVALLELAEKKTIRKMGFVSVRTACK